MYALRGYNTFSNELEEVENILEIYPESMDEHALTAAISRVRNKIETPDRKYIKTVYGMGYMLSLIHI